MAYLSCSAGCTYFTRTNTATPWKSKLNKKETSQKNDVPVKTLFPKDLSKKHKKGEKKDWIKIQQMIRVMLLWKIIEEKNRGGRQRYRSDC